MLNHTVIRKLSKDRLTEETVPKDIPPAKKRGDAELAISLAHQWSAKGSVPVWKADALIDSCTGVAPDAPAFEPLTSDAGIAAFKALSRCEFASSDVDFGMLINPEMRIYRMWAMAFTPQTTIPLMQAMKDGRQSTHHM